MNVRPTFPRREEGSIGPILTLLSLEHLDQLERMVEQAAAGRPFDLSAVVNAMIKRQAKQWKRALARHPIPDELRPFYDFSSEYEMTLDFGIDESGIAKSVEVRLELLRRAAKSYQHYQGRADKRLSDADLKAIFDLERKRPTRR